MQENEKTMYVAKLEYVDDDGEQPTTKVHYEVMADDPDAIATFMQQAFAELHVNSLDVRPLDVNKLENAEAIYKLASNQGTLFEGSVD